MANATWDKFLTVARSRGDTTAVFVGEELVSFDELLEAAKLFAAEMQVTKGARVLICAANAPVIGACVAAIWHRGAIPVMIDADSPSSHVAHAVATAMPELVITDHDLPEVDGFPTLELGPFPRRDEPGASTQPEAEELLADDPASIVFTSGSTGKPKGVTQSAGNLLSGVERVSTLLGYTSEDRILCSVPFSFDYGWGQLLSLLLGGVPLVLPTPRNAFGLCAALEAHAPTVFAGVPAAFTDLVSGLSPIRNTRRDTVRLITNTGSKIPERTFSELLELFPAAEISLNYGLTETYRSAALPTSSARSAPGSVGFAIPGVELDIVRPDGTVADPEEPGEIIHRGAGVFLGYWGDPERTDQVLRSDPVRGPAAPKVVFTGDIGHKDANGMLFIHGRRDRQIKSMGVRVSPDEVEKLLLRNALIREAAVMAVPNEMLGDMIVACIVLEDEPRNAPTEGELKEVSLTSKEALKNIKADARDCMSVYMQPRKYEVLDSLPRTVSGKVDYAALKSAVLKV